MAQAASIKAKTSVFNVRASAATHASHPDRWFYSYGLFNSAAISVDTLIIIFATVVISASPSVISVVDVLDSVGAVAAAAVFGRVVDRIKRQRKLLVASFALTALSSALFALSDTIFMLMGLSLIFGFFMGAAAPSTAILVTGNSQRSSWAVKFGQLNKIYTMGGGLGLAFCIAWVGLMSNTLGTSAAIRYLFLICSGAALLASALAFIWVKEKDIPASSQDEKSQPLAARQRPGHLLKVNLSVLLAYRVLFNAVSFAFSLPRLIASFIVQIPIWLLGVRRFFQGIPGSPEGITSHSNAVLPQLWYEYRHHQLYASSKPQSKEAFKESLIIYFASTFALFLGFGMANTIMPMFITRQLGAPSYVAILSTAVFISSATVSYGYISKEINYITPIRMQSIAIFLRALIFIAIGFLGILFSGLPAIVLLLMLVASSGAAWAALTVAGSTRTALLAPDSRRGEAMGIHSSLINLGTIVGALCGGLTAQQIGFVPVFEIAAALSVVAMFMLLKL
jgi:MFS family permease